jgi:outer membrane protein TolC
MESLEAERLGVRASGWPELRAAVSAQEFGQWKPLNPTYSAQLVLAWDVPWSGMLSDQIRRSSMREADLQVAQQVERKELEERAGLARDTIAALSRQWDTVEGQVALVARQQNLVRNRYNSGKASAIELSISDMDMVNIRVDRVKVGSQFVVAAFDLAEAVGVPVEEGVYP